MQRLYCSSAGLRAPMMELWLASTLAIRLTATPSRRAPSAPRETRKPTPRSPRRLRLSRYPHSPGSFPSGSSPRRAVPGSYRPARNSPCRAGSVSFRPWSIPLSCAQHGHAAGCIALQRLADLLFHAIKRGLIFAQRAVAQLDLVSLDGALHRVEVHGLRAVGFANFHGFTCCVTQIFLRQCISCSTFISMVITVIAATRR